MYKLLLISDQEEVLRAFVEVGNWERTGFKQLHIRHDFEGAKDSLAKHHADGIAIAVEPEEEERILAYLQEYFPNVSIFEAGRTEQEILRYLSELKILLSTPAIPTIVGPEMVMRQVSSMEDMPAMGAAPWLHSRLITVPLAAGLKVFLTTISMFFVKAG